MPTMKHLRQFMTANASLPDDTPVLVTLDDANEDGSYALMQEPEVGLWNEYERVETKDVKNPEDVRTAVFLI